MLKVKQCCCGCSLEKGTLILLWLSLIGGFCSTFVGVAKLFSAGESHDDDLSFPHEGLAAANSFFSTFTAFACFITAANGLCGIRMNEPKRLTPYLQYLGVSIVYLMVVMIVAFFDPYMYNIALDDPENTQVTTQLGHFTFLFATVLGIYFFVVVRSCRDSMLEKAAAAGNNAVVQV